MTAVPSASSGDARSSILFCWNPNAKSKSWILRSDFADDGSVKEPVEETSVRAEAQKYLQTPYLSYTLAGYNDMPRVQLGTKTCNLIGFEVVVHGPAMSRIPLNPAQTKEGHGFWSGGGICCRLNATNYAVTEVGGPGGTNQALTGVRCFAISPFAEEEGTIYVGGYDPNKNPSEHTAFIFKCRPE